MKAQMFILCVLALPLAAGAQETASKNPSPEPSDGFWPTEKLTNLFLQRWVDEMAYEFDLDSEQQAQAVEKATKRWPKFMKEHRKEFQPLLNDWIEMRMEMTPPTPERVAAWAKRAEGALNLFKAEADHAIEDFRGVLNPLQKAKFESNVLEFSMGMTAAQAKIAQWKTGEFGKREFWDPPSSEWRRQRDAERKASQAEAGEAAPPTDKITEELTAWDRYVERFIITYKLDEAQQDAARSFLNELKERASAHRDRNLDRIAKLEKRIAEGNRSEEETADLKKSLMEVYGPIDDMFKELQTRLDAIPTQQQREMVKQPESPKDK